MIIIYIVFKDGLKNEYKLLRHLGYLPEKKLIFTQLSDKQYHWALDINFALLLYCLLMLKKFENIHLHILRGYLRDGNLWGFVFQPQCALRQAFTPNTI